MTVSQLGSSESISPATERPDREHPGVDLTTSDELQLLEREFAYIHASGIIEGHCLPSSKDGAMVFFDTRSAEIDITDEVRYLHSRRLLDVHPEHPHWISLRDESEPLEEQVAS